MSEQELISKMKLLSQFAEHIRLSCGKDGLIYFHEGSCWQLKVPQVPVRSTVGAGDTTLAGFLAALTKGMSPTEAARYAAACGTASVGLEGTEAIHPSDVAPLLDLVRAERI